MGLVATVFIATFTTGAIAQTAQPGDPLFGVRKALETVQVALVSDPAQKAAIQLSIADERLQRLEHVAPAKLEAVLNESKRALDTAQNSVSALTGADEITSAGLLSQLQALLSNQKSIIETVINNNIDNKEIEKTVIAFRNELDNIIPNTDKTPVVEEETKSNIYYGALVEAFGYPSINTGTESYPLLGTTQKILQYVGSDNVRVVGDLVKSPTANSKWGIQVQEITVDSQLIFDSRTINQYLFSGALVVTNNQPVLDTGGRVYLLIGGNANALLRYAGSKSVRVVGTAVEDPTPNMKWGIVIDEISVDSQLIFENQDHIVNDLPRVEDSQNS
jgi:hypothetical protein